MREDQDIGLQDDPEAFIDLYERTAEACGLPQTYWPVHLIPLLSGEEQMPVQNILVYDDLKRAILQQVSLNPEQHRQLFGLLELGENGQPLVMAQQVRDTCCRLLLVGGGGIWNSSGTVDCAAAEEDCTVGPVPLPGPSSLDLGP
ncbi:SCAN domain-containing SCAND2P [Labeo rohita]|uniref:Acyl carrier protein n=2 Tax=Labeo rohita TaxID=84645 RepID=A0ABQ8LCX9_LABRO|nr:Acyl carrier protein [Labeo rohita]RXN06631.1 SCAN domain-containing SCAND2P [Labeo rohita]